jgi:hypothetical protein
MLESPTFISELRVARTPVKKLETELIFESAEHLAHHRLRAFQLAARGRETSFLGGRYKCSQLTQRDVIKHSAVLMTQEKKNHPL